MSKRFQNIFTKLKSESDNSIFKIGDNVRSGEIEGKITAIGADKNGNHDGTFLLDTKDIISSKTAKHVTKPIVIRLIPPLNDRNLKLEFEGLLSNCIAFKGCTAFFTLAPSYFYFQALTRAIKQPDSFLCVDIQSPTNRLVATD